MRNLTFLAPAKLNLSIDIVGRREDGYHQMKMVMQTVSLFDRLTLSLQNEGITVFCDDPTLPAGANNLAGRAASAFFSASGLTGGVCINLQKRIPSGAGMGGGSADAAAVLAGLNRLYANLFPVECLLEIGASVGSDVPFCLVGGTALAEGIGERITPLPPMADCPIVVAKPNISVNTAAAFAEFDRQSPVRRPDTEGLISALGQNDLRRIGDLLCNVFEETTNLPAVTALREKLLSHGAAGASMTGSGSAVFGLFSSTSQAESSRRSLLREGERAWLCQPVNGGSRKETE